MDSLGGVRTLASRCRCLFIMNSSTFYVEFLYHTSKKRGGATGSTEEMGEHRKTVGIEGEHWTFIFCCHHH
jgi:hypothetical protein